VKKVQIKPKELKKTKSYKFGLKKFQLATVLLACLIAQVIMGVSRRGTKRAFPPGNWD